MITIAPKEYLQFAGTVSNSFGKSWDKVQDQFDTAYQFLKNIPDQAWLPMAQAAVQQWEKWPSNIVKAIRELYGNWAHGGMHEGVIEYDRTEDLRFPVGIMHRAFNILYEQGYGPYHAYCDSVHMPKNDRDRVENKCRVVQSSEPSPKLPEIGHRVNAWKPRPAIAQLREEY